VRKPVARPVSLPLFRHRDTAVHFGLPSLPVTSAFPANATQRFIWIAIPSGHFRFSAIATQRFIWMPSLPVTSHFPAIAIQRFILDCHPSVTSAFPAIAHSGSFWIAVPSGLFLIPGHRDKAVILNYRPFRSFLHLPSR
jgi:hypothetical protein